MSGRIFSRRSIFWWRVLQSDAITSWIWMTLKMINYNKQFCRNLLRIFSIYPLWLRHAQLSVTKGNRWSRCCICRLCSLTSLTLFNLIENPNIIIHEVCSFANFFSTGDAFFCCLLSLFDRCPARVFSPRCNPFLLQWWLSVVSFGDYRLILLQPILCVWAASPL